MKAKKTIKKKILYTHITTENDKFFRSLAKKKSLTFSALMDRMLDSMRSTKNASNTL